MLLHHEFIKTAKAKGNSIAIIDRTVEKEFTFSKALLASLLLSGKFKKIKDGYVGVMIPTSAGCMLTTIGLLFCGKVPVMINYSTGAAENARYAQNKCGCKTIITSKKLLEKINCPFVPGMIFIEDILESISLLDKIKAAVKSKLPENMILKSVHQGDSNDDVVILFTSGSEKSPKAVQLSHKNIYSNYEGVLEQLDIADDDIVLSTLPLFHVFGFNIHFWLPLMRGLQMVSYANPLDFKITVEIIKQYKPTIIVGTPIFFIGYLREAQAGDLSSVRLAVAGADKTPDWLRKAYAEKHEIDLLEGYGCTETSPVVSVNSPTDNKPGSIGKVLPNVKVRIIDLETGEELSRGQEGKITVKGDLVMTGYFDDIEETSLRMKNGWYDTGDMGVLDENGFLWHKGRLKRFVKIGGEMVSLVRTECVLEELLPDKIECCIVEIPDRMRGAKIIAVVTEKINEKEILKKMSEKLPNIFLPKKFEVFPELPKTGTHKIDFKNVAEMVRAKLS